MDYYKLKVLNNKRIIIFIIIFVIIVVFLIYYFFIYNKTNNSDEVIVNDIVEEEVYSNDEIYVDIKGHVNKPGVYSFKLNQNARINDLILKAGGLSKDADTSTINLSKKLEDEMTIIIYSKNEISNYIKTQDDLRKKLELCEVKLKNNACIKEEKKEKTSDKVNINEASIDELLTIPGIGESKAKSIIEYRGKNKFKSIEDIKNVDGIGENLFASIKENITI